MHNRKLTRLSDLIIQQVDIIFNNLCEGSCPIILELLKIAMKLSDNGIIAQEQWIWLKDQYSYFDLLSFIVMPDHVHGIIYIDTDFYKSLM